MKQSGLSFHHIGLKCADLARSLKFYEALGLREVIRWGEGEGEIVMLAMDDGGRIELFADGGDAYAVQGKWVHFAMGCEDVDGMYEKALAAGAAPLTPPKTVPLESKPEKVSIRIAFVKGPDGEEVEFFRQLS
ncbi:MAG: VOC family protein [Clostridia bacterium]|nr:VOC family protein [Clostridia bacterium]